MEAFKEAWFAIDTEGKGSISAQEMKVYMKKQNYDDAFLIKWMKLFDQDNSGTIELEEFCDVLGLNYKEVVSEVQVRVASGSGGLPDGVVVISSDMELSWQIKIAQLCLEGLRSTAALKDVPKWIKTQSDRLYNQLWHVVILKGQFWCDYGHEPGFSFVFRFEKYIFIIFKTPVI